MRTHWAVVAAILVVGSYAWAAEPYRISPDAKEYSRAAGQALSTVTSIDASASECIRSASGGGRCAQYSWNSIVTVRPSGVGSCCWSGDPNASLGAQAAETALTLTASVAGINNGVDVGCYGYGFAANETHDLIPLRRQVERSDTYHGRVCSTQVMDQSGKLVWPACAKDADCTALAGGTCGVATEAQKQDQSVSLICRPENNSTLFFAHPEM